MAELLRLEALTAGYGDAVVLDDVSLAPFARTCGGAMAPGLQMPPSHAIVARLSLRPG